jgi:hypothetical protein
MTRAQIIKAAEQNTAIDFLEFLYENKVRCEILDQDNLMDENDGYFNLIVAGMGDGESILFCDGEFQGL